MNSADIEWYAEHARASEFLIVMLHWQAVMGAFGCTLSALVDEEFPARLSNWHYSGEVNSMRAYSRNGVALCWLKWDGGWRVFAASAYADRLEGLTEQLSITWDPDYG